MLHQKAQPRKEHIMAQDHRKNWRDLCNALVEAKDPDDVLRLAHELNQALEWEEEMRRDLSEVSSRAD
jgi:hypothetical protein